MKTKMGLWIDHEKAVVVAMAPPGAEILVIQSKVEKHPGRLAGVRSTTPYEALQKKADDSRQRKLTGQLNIFYEAVIAAIRNADAILIFGPSEAKGELKKRLSRDGLGSRIVAIETAGRIPYSQIVAKVQEYFRVHSDLNQVRRLPDRTGKNRNKYSKRASHF